MGCLFGKQEQQEPQNEGTEFQQTQKFDFLQTNNNQFQGFPNYNELTKNISTIMKLDPSQWSSYQIQLQGYEKDLNLYINIIEQLQDDSDQAKIKQLCEKNNIELSPSLRVELQKAYFLEATNSQFKIQMNVKEDTLDTIKDSSIQTTQSNQCSWMQVMKFPIKNDRQTENLEKCSLSLKLFNTVSDQEYQMGTFVFIELKDQQVHEKVVRVRKSDGNSLVSITVRLQLIWNVSEVLEWWSSELDNRLIQIKRILNRISEQGDVSQIDTKRGIERLDTNLMSVQNDRLKTETVYELPFQVK